MKDTQYNNKNATPSIKDTQHNGTQHNGTQHNNTKYDTYHK